MDKFKITEYEQKDPTTGRHVESYSKFSTPKHEYASFSLPDHPIQEWSQDEWQDLDYHGVFVLGTMEEFKRLEDGRVTNDTYSGYTVAEVAYEKYSILAIFLAKVSEEHIIAMLQERFKEAELSSQEESSSRTGASSREGASCFTEACQAVEQSEDEDEEFYSEADRKFFESIRTSPKLSAPQVIQELRNMFLQGDQEFSFNYSTRLQGTVGMASLFWDFLQKNVFAEGFAARVSHGNPYKPNEWMKQVFTIDNTDGKCYIPTCNKRLPPGFYQKCGQTEHYVDYTKNKTFFCLDCVKERSKVEKKVIDVHIKAREYTGGFIVTCTKRYPEVTNKVTVSTQTGDELQVDKQGQGGSKRQKVRNKSLVDKQGQGGSKGQEMQDTQVRRVSTRESIPTNHYAPEDKDKHHREFKF